MKKIIDALRVTAKLLLGVAPVMILSGLLTAQPYLLSWLGFATARLLHTKIIAAIFLALLFTHSLLGILYLVQRNKKLGRGVKIAAISGWSALFLGIGSLFFVPMPDVGDGLDEEVPLVEIDAGGSDSAISTESGEVTTDASQTSDGDLANDASIDATVALDTDPVDQVTVGTDAARPDDSQLASRPSPRPRARPRPRPSKAVSPSLPPGGSSSGDGGGTPSPAPAEEPPPSPPAEPVAPRLSGSQLVQARCSLCHGLDVITNARHTPAEWSGVVGRMVATGARLSDEERRLVISSLARRYPSD
jgi:mono/diheme cytochrome c family protein